MVSLTHVDLQDCELATPEQMASYEDVQAYAQEHKIKSMRAWFIYHNIHQGGHPRPRNIPGDPSKFFSRHNQWFGWADLLGTNTKATQQIKDDFMSLPACRQWLRRNKIYTVSQFRELCKKGQRPAEIPSAPDKHYGLKFSELLCPKKSPYLSFEAAKAKISQYGFKSYLEYRHYRRDHIEKLYDIPYSPDKIYNKVGQWSSWADFLGPHNSHC